MSATTENATAIRNYILTAVSVVILSAGITDLFANPARVAQQDRLDNYGRVISAGLVAQAQTWGR